MEDKKIFEIERIMNDRYIDRYKSIGVSPKTLGWGKKQEQRERFKRIIEYYDLSGKTVMDIGCGFADMYEYLCEEKIEVNYIGVDINPEFIKFCKEKFPKQSFYCKNIMIDKEDIPETDVVVAIGVLNLKLEGICNYEYSKQFIEKAYNLSKEITFIDFLSEYRSEQYPKEEFVFYHSPEKVFTIAASLTEDITIMHDYPPIPQKEFILVMMKGEDKFD